MSDRLLQIDPPIWVQTPLGEGRAVFLIDYGLDHNPIFIIQLNNGQFRCVDMVELRSCENRTVGVWKPDPPKHSNAAGSEPTQKIL